MGLRRRLSKKWNETVDGFLTGPGVDVDSATTDELDFSNPFIQSGDVIPFISANGVAKQSFSVSNDSYQTDREFVAARLRWSDLFNEEQQIAVGASFRVPGNDNADVRVQNATQSETIVGDSNLSPNSNYFLGFENYTPPDLNSTDIIWIEVATSNSNSSTTVADGLLYIGPRL